MALAYKERAASPAYRPALLGLDSPPRSRVRKVDWLGLAG